MIVVLVIALWLLAMAVLAKCAFVILLAILRVAIQCLPYIIVGGLALILLGVCSR